MRITITLSLLLLWLPIAHAQSHLKKGDVAPVFSVLDLQGNRVEVPLKNGEKVLLVFFRYAGCVVCNFRAHELIESYDSLRRKGIRVIGVFESKEDLLRTYVADSEIPFPIISDHKGQLYKKYKVEKSICKVFKGLRKKQTKYQEKEGEKLYKGKKYRRDASLRRIPADFLIDEKGRIEIAYYGKYLGDHLPLDQLP